MRTIAIDFDGVIHAYSKGWQDGSIYDNPIEGCFEAINEIIKQGFAVFIFSTRNADQILNWLYDKAYYEGYTFESGLGAIPDGHNSFRYRFSVEKIPPDIKFWNKKGVLGITNIKLPALCYIDDRAITFKGNWDEILPLLKSFKTYQEI